MLHLLVGAALLDGVFEFLDRDLRQAPRGHADRRGFHLRGVVLLVYPHGRDDHGHARQDRRRRGATAAVVHQAGTLREEPGMRRRLHEEHALVAVLLELLPIRLSGHAVEREFGPPTDDDASLARFLERPDGEECHVLPRDGEHGAPTDASGLLSRLDECGHGLVRTAATEHCVTTLALRGLIDLVKCPPACYIRIRCREVRGLLDEEAAETEECWRERTRQVEE
mmetsp:Transcript_94528/g.305221  ORF Transcript_94528/g.305221 Transcript_94528/m.305221 type:complete len:225 (+) Transcript_94528:297-971(+)